MAQTTLLDAISGLAIAASGSSSITVGTAVVPTWTRHPQATAAAALTAQAATGGRFVLGIGLLHKPVVENYFQMTWEKPIRHMLDYLDVLQPLLTEGAADHTGEVWSYTGSSARPTTDPPKVMLAALGEQMLKIAGRRTDGTILWCVGPKTIERQIAPLINGAAERGRAPESVRSCAACRCGSPTTPSRRASSSPRSSPCTPRSRRTGRCSTSRECKASTASRSSAASKR